MITSCLNVAIIVTLAFTAVRASYVDAQTRSQEVMNETFMNHYNLLNDRLNAQLTRISRLEEANPELVRFSLEELKKDVDQQQKLLWAIAIAVIINLLTSNTSRFNFRLKREEDGELRPPELPRSRRR